MKKDDLCYGLEHWEVLEGDPDDAVERVLADACDKVGEGFDIIADRIDWPIKILVYKRRDVGGETYAQLIADRALDNALENLDDEYLGECTNFTTPTDKMKAAALEFGRAIVSDYVPWTCEPNGEVIEYTREQAEHEEKCLADMARKQQSQEKKTNNEEVAENV